MFVNGAASTLEGALALQQQSAFLAEHPTNVAILCLPGWKNVRDYPNSILGPIKPELVMLSHFDNFGAPYKNNEDPQLDMNFVLFADYAGFVKELKTLKELHGYRYEIYQPRTGECIRFPSVDRKLACER